MDEAIDIEKKSQVRSCVTQPNESLIDFSRFSSYSRLLRVVASAKRFIHYVRVGKDKRKQGALTAVEFEEADDWLISRIQYVLLRKCS